MTETRALSVEEEAKLRRDVAELPRFSGRADIVRLFATLDAERARDYECLECGGRGQRLDVERARLSEPPPLDVAWAEAEAALPDYVVGMHLGHAYYRDVGGSDFGDGPDLRVSQRYYAGTVTGPSHREIGEYGPTPADALRALRAALQAEPKPEPWSEETCHARCFSGGCDTCWTDGCIHHEPKP